MSKLDEYRVERTRMNDRIAEIEHLGIKRFFNLDIAAYKGGALDARTKELLGLVASTVLRCKDCIDYHLIQCVKAGYNDAEFSIKRLNHNLPWYRYCARAGCDRDLLPFQGIRTRLQNVRPTGTFAYRAYIVNVAIPARSAAVTVTKSALLG